MQIMNKNATYKSINSLFFTIVVIISIFPTFAQNDPVISQQGLQRFIYNPAATGTSNCRHISFINRTQWAHFPDAPRSNILLGNTFFPKYKVGIGIVAIHDKLGLESSTILKSSYSYHIWLNESNIFSFGLSAGIYSKKFDINNLILEEENDLTANELENKIVPDFDFGVEYNSEFLTIGISATHLVNSKKSSNNIKHPRHIHSYMHYKQYVSEYFFIRGIISYYMVRNVNGIELTAIGERENKLWAGLSYRYDESFILLAGIFLNPRTRIGYSYDWNLNVLKRYSSGSHEIFLQFKFGCIEYSESDSPRFFN